MKIEQVLAEIKAFRALTRDLFPGMEEEPTRPMNIKIFPEELDAVAPPAAGVYLMFANDTNELLYVGISDNVSSRIYHHLGKAFVWERDGRRCRFANMRLACDRPWLAPSIQEVLRNGDFHVQILEAKPREYAALIEAFVIARCVAREGARPTVNAQ